MAYDLLKQDCGQGIIAMFKFYLKSFIFLRANFYIRACFNSLRFKYFLKYKFIL